MPNQPQSHDSAYLDRVNKDLAQSLRRCRALVDACRDKLAANSNDAGEDNEPEDERVG